LQKRSTMDLSNQQEPVQCFKLVAIDGQGRYVSIFDGVTEYKIGETMTAEVRAGHKGGIYVCESILDLLKLGEPNCAGDRAPRARIVD
jgi:tRNA U34 2-thiouridine synthase MnmA/TrmU